MKGNWVHEESNSQQRKRALRNLKKCKDREKELLKKGYKQITIPVYKGFIIKFVIE